MAKNRYYVVWNGRQTGVFDNWDECRRSVEGYPDPKYKSFDSYDLAVTAYKSDSKKYIAANFKKNVTVIRPPFVRET